MIFNRAPALTLGQVHQQSIHSRRNYIAAAVLSIALFIATFLVFFIPDPRTLSVRIALAVGTIVLGMLMTAQLARYTAASEHVAKIVTGENAREFHKPRFHTAFFPENLYGVYELVYVPGSGVAEQPASRTRLPPDYAGAFPKAVFLPRFNPFITSANPNLRELARSYIRFLLHSTDPAMQLVALGMLASVAEHMPGSEFDYELENIFEIRSSSGDSEDARPYLYVDGRVRGNGNRAYVALRHAPVHGSTQAAYAQTVDPKSVVQLLRNRPWVFQFKAMKRVIVAHLGERVNSTDTFGDKEWPIPPHAYTLLPWTDLLVQSWDGSDKRFERTREYLEDTMNKAMKSARGDAWASKEGVQAWRAHSTAWPKTFLGTPGRALAGLEAVRTDVRAEVERARQEVREHGSKAAGPFAAANQQLAYVIRNKPNAYEAYVKRGLQENELLGLVNKLKSEAGRKKKAIVFERNNFATQTIDLSASDSIKEFIRKESVDLRVGNTRFNLEKEPASRPYKLVMLYSPRERKLGSTTSNVTFDVNFTNEELEYMSNLGLSLYSPQRSFWILAAIQNIETHLRARPSEMATSILQKIAGLTAQTTSGAARFNTVATNNSQKQNAAANAQSSTAAAQPDAIAQPAVAPPAAAAGHATPPSPQSQSADEVAPVTDKAPEEKAENAKQQQAAHAEEEKNSTEAQPDYKEIILTEEQYNDLFMTSTTEDDGDCFFISAMAGVGRLNRTLPKPGKNIEFDKSIVQLREAAVEVAKRHAIEVMDSPAIAADIESIPGICSRKGTWSHDSMFLIELVNNSALAILNMNLYKVKPREDGIVIIEQPSNIRVDKSDLKKSSYFSTVRDHTSALVPVLSTDERGQFYWDCTQVVSKRTVYALNDDVHFTLLVPLPESGISSTESKSLNDLNTRHPLPSGAFKFITYMEFGGITKFKIKDEQISHVINGVTIDIPQGSKRLNVLYKGNRVDLTGTEIKKHIIDDLIYNTNRLSIAS